MSAFHDGLRTASHTYRRLESETTERAVCDYLASMTDKFFLRRYAEIFNQDVPPVG